MTETIIVEGAPKGYQDWANKLFAATENYRTSLWEIGDLLNTGENKFGELYVQAASMTNLSPDRLKVLKWVSASVPQSNRREDLSFARHQEVAKLESSYQTKFLDLSTEHNWASLEIRKRIKAVLSGDDQALMPTWTVPHIPSSQGETPPEAETGGTTPQDTPPVEAEPKKDIMDMEYDEDNPRPVIERPQNRVQYLVHHMDGVIAQCFESEPDFIITDAQSNGIDMDRFWQLVDDTESWMVALKKLK